MPKPFAHGYSKQTPSGNEEDVTFYNPSWAFAAGQMISNFEDLKIWAKALGTGALLSKKVFQERLASSKLPPNTNERYYGLGVGFDHGWLIHAGELPGYNGVVAYFPEKNAIFVCLVNSDIPIKKSAEAPKINQEFLFARKDQSSPVALIYRSMLRILFPKNVPE